MALTKDDLNNIKGIVTDAVNGGVAELAQMVADGFGETAKTGDVERRFDAVDKRFDRLEADVDALRWDVGDVKKHLGTIENAFAMPAELRFAARKRPRPMKRAS